MDAVILLAGLTILVVGAELLVRGSSRLAAAVGIPPLVVGVTFVAFGTSAPELAVSVVSAVEGETGITLGNIIGGNIFNVLMILGLTAVIAPLRIAPRVIRIEVPLMIGVSVLFAVLALNGTVGWHDGVVLLLALSLFVWLSFKRDRRSPTDGQPGPIAGTSSLDTGTPFRRVIDIALSIAGLAGLAFGADWVTGSAVSLAQQMGVSDVIAGIVIVGGATSLPEALTSIVATLRKQRDLAIGNIIGSNVFNICGALGAAAIVAPGGIPVPEAAIHFDIPVLLAVAVACLPILFTGRTVSRWEGGLFVAYFVAYIAYLVMEANRHDALPAYSTVMLLFVIPLTVLALGVSVWRSLVARRTKSAVPAAD